MAITAVDKVKINKYLKEHAFGDICYLGMCEAIGKRQKIDDVEFIKYFTETIINEFQNSDKVSINHMTKLITTVEAFLTWINESNSKIDEEILDKIRSFGDFYQEYIDRTNQEKDFDFYNDYIDDLLKKVDELYLSEIKSESITKYISKIKELEDLVNKLNRELKNAEIIKNSIQSSNEQKSNDIERLSKEITDLRNETKNKSKNIKRLNENIDSLNIEIEQLQKKVVSIEEENILLKPYKEKYEEVFEEVSKLRKEVKDYFKIKKQEEETNAKNREIESLIYSKLLLERVSLDGLLKFVQDNGMVSSKNEIYSLLKNIKSIIKVDESSFSKCPSYKIVSPTIVEDRTFSINVPNECKSIDLMLAADFHIQEFNKKALLQFDMLNEYCVNHGINLILNLGDFFNGLCCKNVDYDNAIKNYRLVEEAISLIPKANGLYHAILGGNHDLSIVKYGFDPLEVLSNNREDIINLGYLHSTIQFENSIKKIGEFDIHHPDTFTLPMSMNDDVTEMNSYLEDVYNRCGRDRSNSYIDIFGHTHINRFNYPESYYYIGPFKTCACHVKINFDEDNEIQNMIFMPLSVTSKLTKNNEIVYQKKLYK